MPAQIGCTDNIVEALALTVRDETGTEVTAPVPPAVPVGAKAGPALRLPREG
ncbi:MAG: hypothetical protein MUF34_36845 [Polyangiaceae bacterium]|nr:hypothetical protein [Polyangiaceae bacterium]